MDIGQNKTFYIYRHAETYSTKRHKPYWLGFYSSPIIKEGSLQINGLSKKLTEIKFDVHYSSTFKRCRQTAVALGKHITGPKIRYDPRLGDYLYLETPLLLRFRLNKFLKEICNASNTNILICSHEIPISEMVNILTGKNSSLKLPPAGMVVIKNSQIVKIINSGILN